MSRTVQGGIPITGSELRQSASRACSCRDSKMRMGELLGTVFSHTAQRVLEQPIGSTIQLVVKKAHRFGDSPKSQSGKRVGLVSLEAARQRGSS